MEVTSLSGNDELSTENRNTTVCHMLKQKFLNDFRLPGILDCESRDSMVTMECPRRVMMTLGLVFLVTKLVIKWYFYKLCESDKDGYLVGRAELEEFTAPVSKALVTL